MAASQVRRIYCPFEFERDARRWKGFISQANQYCVFRIDDRSLPSAIHDQRWQREALKRIKSCDVMIVLLGQDTFNAPGVCNELSLAGQAEKPVIQLMPQKKTYGRVSRTMAVCSYKWKRINEMLRDPRSFVASIRV